MDRQKIRKLINESIQRNIVLNEIKNTNILDKIDRINYDMNLQGHPPYIIQEGVFDLLGSGLISAFKQNVAEYLAKLVGVNIDSVVGRFLVNFLEEFEFLGMGKYFEEGKCKEVPKLVARAGIETLTELQGGELIKVIYYSITGEETIDEIDTGMYGRLDAAMNGLITAAGREVINEFIYNWIGPIIEPKIEAVFCEYDSLKDFLYNGVYKGEAVDQLGSLGAIGAVAGAGSYALDQGLEAADDSLVGRDIARRTGSGADFASRALGRDV